MNAEQKGARARPNDHAYSLTILGRITALDADIRDASPKCTACGRPDGGIVLRGQTAWTAGLVDRARCPVAVCPMKQGANRGLQLRLGADNEAEKTNPPPGAAS